MKPYLWIAGAVLLGVIALAVWIDLRDPVFVAGLGAAALAALVKAVLPKVLRHSPATDARSERAAREGRMGDPHAGREK